MMNLVALWLVATSLVGAALWSPTSDRSGESFIVKEGHRVVVVEYDREGDPITKVSISPETEAEPHQRRPEELICDAYGRCVNKIAEAMGKTKEAAAGTARQVEEEVKEVAKNVTGFLGRVRWEVAGRMVSGEGLDTVSGTAYLVAFCTAYGTAVFVTFVLSHVLAAALPPQQFGVVQSKICPVYFRSMAVSLATALFWFVAAHRGKVISRLPELVQLYNLSASLFLVFVNALVLEPRATKAMFEKMKMEKEEGRGIGREEMAAQASAPNSSTPASERPEGKDVRSRSRTECLNVRLKKLNTCSSLLNILTLMSLSWHVFYLGHRLHMIIRML